MKKVNSSSNYNFYDFKTQVFDLSSYARRTFKIEFHLRL